MVHKSEEQKGAIKNVKIFFETREKVINLFDDHTTIVSNTKYKAKLGEGLKILTAKQMIQRLPIVLAQVKAGNTSENLLNEVRQIIYSLYQVKEITKKVYNNRMNSVKLENRRDTIYMNSENSKTSDPHRLLVNLSGKLDLKKSDKYVALPNLSIYYT